MQDTVCPNVAQNIIIVSTPAEERISKYARIEALTIGSREYEVYAYQAVLDGTVKGVIRNISTEDTQEEIIENIVNDYNPTAIDARRIGKSSAIVVLFQGEKVPMTVKYRSVLVRCSLYRQHREVCKCCGGVGHRQDMCPQPEKSVCFACGKQNPSENHAANCAGVFTRRGRQAAATASRRHTWCGGGSGAASRRKMPHQQGKKFLEAKGSSRRSCSSEVAAAARSGSNEPATDRQAEAPATGANRRPGKRAGRAAIGRREPRHSRAST